MKVLSILLLLAGIMIAGCSCGGIRVIHGVPEGQWARMNEEERQVAIERFKQQQEINAQTRARAEKVKEEIHTQAETAREETEEFVRQCYEDDFFDDTQDCQVITRHRIWLPK